MTFCTLNCGPIRYEILHILERYPYIFNQTTTKKNIKCHKTQTYNIMDESDENERPLQESETESETESDQYQQQGKYNSIFSITGNNLGPIRVIRPPPVPGKATRIVRGGGDC